MRGTHDLGFYAASLVAFASCAAATVALCRSMSGAMDMPGGWTMSMAWMKMPEQGWPAATLMFLQMWLVMMVAMMMPSLVPMLMRFRRALRRHDAPHVGASTWLAAIGYFTVWQIVGLVAYPLGVAFAAGTMKWANLSRTVPALTGLALLLCGFVQLSPWKMRKVLHCRDPNACAPMHVSSAAAGAYKHGIDLGVCCASCCSGFMLALLVLGTMDLVVMTVIALAITLERLLPKPDFAVRLSGAAMLVLGVIAVGRIVTW